ncbi:MAG: hypothetical protein K2R98_23335 [Gemmataceae bacterium]|nr:hypothetical protein [Gemmataceae bacterium]
MDQGTLVENQIDDGARVVNKLRETGFDVIAAWWMKTSEEGQWFLYIASHEVDRKGIAAAYRAIHTVMGSLGRLWVDRFEVKLVNPQNPITKDVLDILARYPAASATRYGGKRLGNVSIDDSYLYPTVVAA